jgi:hypothetical protein
MELLKTSILGREKTGNFVKNSSDPTNDSLDIKN